MKIPYFIRTTVFLVFIFVVASECDAQQYKKSLRNPERQMFGKSLNNKTVKYKEARSIVRAKKKQAKNQARIEREYDAYVKKQKKHNYDIQSPEVRERMEANNKETEVKYKEKKKEARKKHRKEGKKYK